MRSTNSEVLFRWWRNGFAPHEALQDFCSRELVDAYLDALAQHSDGDTFADAFLSQSLNFPDERVSAGPEVSAHARARRAKQMTLLYQLEDEIFEKLENQDLVAVGFAKPRDLFKGPVEIPLDLFVDREGWSLSDQIRGNGLEIEGVRIAERHIGDIVEPPKKRPGRPSRRMQVRKAIDELLAAGEISLTGKRQPQLAKIRKKVLALFPNDPRNEGLGDQGLGDDVLDSVLRTRIEATRTKTLDSEKR